MFDDILVANEAYAASFQLAGLPPIAARGLAIVTCIDSRIEPLAMLGLHPGDAKILRNAGGRVTDDVLRSLVLAVNLLGVDRVGIVHHTECRLVGVSNDALQSMISERCGADAAGWDFLPIADHVETLLADIERVRACPLLPPDLVVDGFVYDVGSGRLHPAR